MSGPERRLLVDRFWERVDRRGPDECWPWTGYRDAKGYGQISKGGHCGPQMPAHRASWELHNGAIPKGAGYHGTCVLHRCDNPGCVNPTHLFLGDHDANMADMKAKGRANGGPGALTVPLPFVNAYRDRHGKPRYYFRSKELRCSLPAEPGTPGFDFLYKRALEKRERLRNLTNSSRAK